MAGIAMVFSAWLDGELAWSIAGAAIGFVFGVTVAAVVVSFFWTYEACQLEAERDNWHERHDIVMKLADGRLEEMVRLEEDNTTLRKSLNRRAGLPHVTQLGRKK